MTMHPHQSGLERMLLLPLWMAGWLTIIAQTAQSETVVLRLRTGDRITGTLVSEDTNRVVLSTGWIKELPVPLTVIQSRETATNGPAKPPATNVVAATQTAPPSGSAAEKSPRPKRWKANLNLGTDVQFGAHDRQLYTGKLKVTYEKPYRSDPKKFFRSLFDYSVDFGKTDGVKSADRMYGSIKTDFDVGHRVFVYNLGGMGYDSVRKIDLEYEVGPGVGYRMFTRPKFVMNLEGGGNYQVQLRSGSPDVRNFYFRIAEDLMWKITPRLTWVEKAEFFPRVEDLGEFRVRLESGLSFALWQNVSLNLSLLDLYDTAPAQGVDRNELQVRSMVGISF